MRVIKDDENGTYTLLPVETDEHMLIESLLASLNRLDKLQYHGQVHAKGESQVLRFNFGGKSVCVPRIVDGDVHGSTPGYEGGLTFVVAASDQESQEALGFMRDMCFFSTGSLTFIKKVMVDDVAGICCTGGFCTSCHMPIIGITALEGTCSRCAEAFCVHEYEKDVFLSPAFGGLVVGELCKHCKHISPDSYERLQQTPRLGRLEEVTAVIRERVPNFIHFLGDPDDPLCMTVEEAVALRDHGTIPDRFQEQVAAEPEVQHLFDRLAEDMRERI